MATTEKKLEAAVLLLDIMTGLMIANTDEPFRLAEEHRSRFDTATKDDPELNAAGLEVAQQLAALDH